MSLELQHVFNRLPSLDAAARDALNDALEDVAEDCLATANETIPYETGLMASGGTARVEGGGIEVGYSAPYAIVQHEDTTLRHDPGRRAKWLELTMRENDARWTRYLGEELGEGLE